MSAPSVIFCNLQNSGGSAIDPILREVLRTHGYHLAKYGPEGTGRLRAELTSGVLKPPFYHWTHDPPETFEGMIGDARYRFIYLHRDPRDAAVSWAHDAHRRGIFGRHLQFTQVLESIVRKFLPRHVEAAVRWARSGCLVIRFDDVRENTGDVVSTILSYIEAGSPDLRITPTDDELDRLLLKHSFETLTGRARGQPGEIIRTGYMLRSGLSGEWLQHFDARLQEDCHALMGEEIAELGYPLETPAGSGSSGTPDACPHPGTAQRSGKGADRHRIQLVAPPFSTGVDALHDLLLRLDLRVTLANLEPGHWESAPSGERLSQRALHQLSNRLPVVCEKTIFQFPERLEIRSGPQLDFAGPAPGPTILFVRDAHEALKQFHKDSGHGSASFEHFLNQTLESPHLPPGLFQLPPLESYAYLCAYWLAMRPVVPLCVIRAEDLATHPCETLGHLLEFLGVHRSTAEVCAASECMRAAYPSGRSGIQTLSSEQSADRIDPSHADDAWRFVARLLDYDGESRGRQPGDWSVPDPQALIDGSIPAPLRTAAQACIRSGYAYHPIPIAQIAEGVRRGRLERSELRQLAALTRALYYVERIFADPGGTPFRAAFGMFFWLNLKFASSPGIGATLDRSIAHLERLHGGPLTEAVTAPGETPCTEARA